MYISNRLDFYEKVSVCSGIAAEQNICSLQQDDFKITMKNKIWTSTLPSSTSQKLAKQLVMMVLKIIVKIGCIAMVLQFHDGMQASVQND